MSDFNKLLSEAVSGIDFSQLSRALVEIAKPTEELRHLFADQLREANRFVEFSAQIAAQAKAFTAAYSQPLQELLAEFAADEHKFGRVEKSGWLPHHTTPFASIPPEADPRAVGQQLADYYRDNWKNVHGQLIDRVDHCAVDGEARETFREALDAHSHEFYRCVPRLLFPEIERVVRDEFFPGDLQTRLASQPHLISAVSDLPGHEVSGKFIAGLRLYKKLARHLYAHVTTDEALDLIKADPVPNRHAALHGLAAYKTQQTSLNAIIMTEFAFELIALFKQYAAEEAA